MFDIALLVVHTRTHTHAHTGACQFIPSEIASGVDSVVIGNKST